MSVSSASNPFAEVVYHHASPWDTAFEPMALPDMFAATTRCFPDAPLAYFMGRRFTYKELFSDAQRFALALKERGVEPGDRIGLFLPNVPLYISAYYGAMMAGAVVVNFSPLYTVEELAQQVADSGTKTLVTIDVPELFDTAEKVLDCSELETLVVGKLAAMLPGLKGLAMKLFARSKIARISYSDAILAWDQLLQSANSALYLFQKHPDLPEVATDALALLQYTGGTTGAPKGAMLSHSNLSINAQQVASINPFDNAQDEVFMGALPMFHVFANTALLNHAVVTGASIAMVPRFEVAQVLDTIAKHGATGFPGVPTMFQALLDNPKLAKTDFSSLKVCISGGAPISAPTRENFENATGVRVVEGYGLTESSGVVSVNPYDGVRKSGTIGQVVPGTLVRFVDKEDATKPAAEGEPGELVIRGPQIMQGYWNRPDAAATAFVIIEGEPWLRTGDVAVIDDDGFIQIVDRTKDMIAVGGFKVFPSQVEAVLVEHEAVKEALVIGMPDDYLGETPYAYITLNEGIAASGEELATWLNERVGKHERVSKVVVRDELPKTMIGKLDRKALRAEVQK
ncbi:long-chain fatty acid--CoA ligase [Pontixanthobacter aestiaquae]|uniref:AMP-binding protein n=1 Tax=Pontixanthobacter aestiaquae TaxID=1509367 RepID=A0A844Z307_9SPHN|nr:long-chain fatty acid--CoA ligase [Pontixanthobacter aestiaquae]MDN3646930.1 long-chain fatty acid--CoA ligase [Pontixanthobacter aestiaquae]MXO82088.1 AMP-binding protein [Pontixanthobacter aestiaquae]